MIQPKPTHTFLDRASDLAQRVRVAFHRLIAAVPGASVDRRGRRTIPGLNATLQSRLVRALDQHEPLHILHQLPGVAGLRRVIDEARARDADPALIADAESITAELEAFFEAEHLDRETLQAMLAGSVPEARDAMVRTSSQMLYKSLSSLRGYTAESLTLIALAYPSDEPDSATVSAIMLIHGLCRLRADAIHRERGYVSPANGQDTPSWQRTLDGIPLSELDQPPIVAALSSDPMPRFEPEPTPLGLAYRLMDQEVGARGVISYATGMTVPRAKPARHQPEIDCAVMSAVNTLPSKRFVFDVLIHDNLWQGITPSAEAYSIVPNSYVSEQTRPMRQADRLDLGLAPVDLGRGALALEHPAIPNHHRALKHLLAAAAIDPQAVRGSRLEVQYPVYGVQYAQVFELPEDQASTPPADA